MQHQLRKKNDQQLVRHGKKKLTRSYSLSCSAQKEVWQRIDKQRTLFHQNLPHLQKENKSFY